MAVKNDSRASSADEAGLDIPRCPLTTRECDEHSAGLAAAQGIVELTRHFIESRHFMDCTSTVPGLEESAVRMGVQMGEIDFGSISAALHSAWSTIRAAKLAIDEAGCREGSEWSANDGFSGTPAR
jgi:hypothetical protein